MLLLLWGAHLNKLHITSSYWSFYLIKYDMKCKTHGKLNLNIKNTKRLSFKNASIIQLKLISNLIMS
jgi:hypothetical protein